MKVLLNIDTGQFERQLHPSISNLGKGEQRADKNQNILVFFSTLGQFNHRLSNEKKNNSNIHLPKKKTPKQVDSMLQHHTGQKPTTDVPTETIFSSGRFLLLI